jgi:predicted RND superfamily exporter protein
VNPSKSLEFISSKARVLSILILGLSVLASLVGIRLLRGLNTQYSIRQFTNSNNPDVKAEFKVRSDFELPEWPYVYVNISLGDHENGTFLEPERIAALKAATEKAAVVAGVDRAVSIATVDGASSTKNGLTVGRVLDLTSEKAWSHRVLDDPLFTPNLISQDAKTVLVAIAVADFSTQVLNQLPDLLRPIFQKQFPNSTIRIGGIPAIQAEMGELLKNELRNFLFLALLACLFTLASFFRDWASIFVPILLVAVANIGALSWMVIAGISFTVLSTTLPVLVSIIVLSMVTHTMIVFSNDWGREKNTSKPDKAKAVMKTIRVLFLPNLLTALTTSLGFVALLGAGVPLIHDYAECVAVGVIVAWACVMFTLPAILYLIPIPRPRRWTASKARWALQVMRHKKVIVGSIFILALGLVWEGRNLNWTARMFDDLPKEREARATTEFIDKNLGAIIPLDLVVRAQGQKKDQKETDFWNAPERVEKLRKLLIDIRRIDGVGSAVGISDFIEAGSKAQNQPLPKTRAGVAEIIFLYSLSEDRLTNQFLTPDGTQTRIAIRVRDIPADQMKRAVVAIESAARQAFPDLDVQVVGMAQNVHPINEVLSKSMIYGFWQAIFLISIVLMLIFRSIRWTLIAMLPNLISPITLMGVLALTATPIKPGIALIFSIALGIAYNNTVYLLGRVRLIQNKIGKTPETPAEVIHLVTRAWYQEGNPCVFSTLALVGGFAVFMASYFELNRIFGAYMLLSLAAGMLGDLIFLPAFLGLFPQSLFRMRKTR